MAPAQRTEVRCAGGPCGVGDRRFLPDALPIRHGLWEPLPYWFSHDEAFIDFVLAEGRGRGVRS